MQVKELANLTGVPAHVIRYYTQIGLLTPERDPKNRYRNYAAADVSRVRFIRRAKWLGFTLRDVRSILSDVDDGVSPCPEVRRLIEQRARENRARLEQFNRLQSRVEEAITLWDSMPDQPPDHDSLCHLIESVAVSEADLDLMNGME
jgi:MerR family transcriptional regulator, Zn(II)-responsive regulator of zntA